MTRRRLVAASASLAWTALWFAPWQLWLRPWPWLRTALALTLFIAPGLGLHAWLTRGMAVRVSGRVTYGFALSVLATGLVGLVGCVSHLSFTFVMASLWVVGLLGPAALALSDPTTAGAADGRAREAMSWLDWLECAVVLAIVARLAFAPAGGGDDFIYVARITRFAQSDGLGFHSIGFGDAPLSPRYWFEYWTLCEAVMATVSGLHPLELTTNYLGPLLAVIALVGVFELALSVGFTRRLATAALTAQVIVLVMLAKEHQPGFMFFNRLTEDKVVAAFVLSPAALAAVAHSIASPPTGLLLVALLYIGLFTTHPTSFGIAVLMALSYCVAAFATSRARNVLRVMIVLTALAVPASMMRLASGSSLAMAETEFTSTGSGSPMRLARLWVGPDGRWYAVSRTVIPSVALGVGVVALGIAVLRLRRDPAAAYVAGALAVVGFTCVPYTAWIVAAGITPFHLWRVVWQAPFGIALVVVLTAVIDVLRRRVPPSLVRRLLRANLSVVSELVLLALLVGAVRYGHVRDRLWALHVPLDWRTFLYREGELVGARLPCRRTYADLIAMGQLIDQHAPRGATVIGDPATNNLIPSVSIRARLLMFRAIDHTREHAGVTPGEARRRVDVQTRLFHRTTPAAERSALLRENRIDYVLLCGRPDWAAEVAAVSPGRFTRVATAGDFELYRVLTPVESEALRGHE
ncbi:MAG: hypothetical protein HYR72_13370 [Deltaproteobacteria bacterium]|nr:hypothetical protein [Deltaproteobacteria bacterium]MBI3386901.1 hypothetical protein [Deltaproteobacteria bacterium]